MPRDPGGHLKVAAVSQVLGDPGAAEAVRADLGRQPRFPGAAFDHLQCAQTRHRPVTEGIASPRLAAGVIGRFVRRIAVRAPDPRRASQRRFCKGEARHTLARAHPQGRIRDRSQDAQQKRVMALNLVIAAIVHWNTWYLDKAADHLRRHGRLTDPSLLRVVCGRGRNTTVSVPTPGTARRIELIWGRVEDLPWWRTKCDSARAGPEDPFGPLPPRPANGPYGGISRSLGRKIEFQATARAGRFAYRSISPPPANDPNERREVES